jgi:hypothetical protein
MDLHPSEEVRQMLLKGKGTFKPGTIIGFTGSTGNMGIWQRGDGKWDYTMHGHIGQGTGPQRIPRMLPWFKETLGYKYDTLDCRGRHCATDRVKTGSFPGWYKKGHGHYDARCAKIKEALREATYGYTVEDDAVCNH